jgi:hypothetical protein
MCKMNLHDPFEYLKHTLWPKEGSGVKLTIWFSTTKNQESPWFPCLQVACNIPLKRSQWGLQLCFKPHPNWRFAHKIMGLQSCKNYNFGSFETPTWKFRDSNLRVPRQNDIWVLFLCPCIEHIIRGKVVVFPKSRRLVNPCLLMVYLCTKNVLVMH